MHDLAVALVGRGHEVTILTSHQGPTSRAVEEGVRVVRLRRPRDRVLEPRGYEYYLARAPQVALQVLRGKYEIAHAFFQSDALAAVLARGLGGPPVVFSLMGIPWHRWLDGRRHRRPLFRVAVRGSAAATVLSAAAGEAFASELPGEASVLPGGAFVDDFRWTGGRAAEPTLLCAASLNDRRKRGELLLRAFQRLRARRPDARLLLVGRSDPRQGTSQLQLPDGVEQVPTEATADLARAYGRSWASVLPSVDEAFGLVLVESLAAGTPVVAARSGASPEVVSTAAVGRLFEPDNEAALALAMDEGLELGMRPETAKHCRRRAQAFDWSAVLPRYERLYEAVASRRGVS